MPIIQGLFISIGEPTHRWSRRLYPNQMNVVFDIESVEVQGPNRHLPLHPMAPLPPTGHQFSETV